jgi:hypothetical protein
MDLAQPMVEWISRGEKQGAEKTAPAGPDPLGPVPVPDRDGVHCWPHQFKGDGYTLQTDSKSSISILGIYSSREDGSIVYLWFLYIDVDLGTSSGDQEVSVSHPECTLLMLA